MKLKTLFVLSVSLFLSSCSNDIRAGHGYQMICQNINSKGIVRCENWEAVCYEKYSGTGGWSCLPR